VATLYTDARSAPLRLLHTSALESEFPVAPTGAAHTLVFDEATNAALAADMALNLDAYSFDGTTLKKAGAAVQIVAESQETTVRKGLGALLPQLLSGSATPQQTQRAVYIILRVLARNGLL
jgi:ethanolamine utilization microcompartment shell protein EutL